MKQNKSCLKMWCYRNSPIQGYKMWKQRYKLWHFLKSDWYFHRALLSDSQFIVWSWKIHSIVLEISGSSKMSLKFFGSVLRPFLYKGLIFVTSFVWERGKFYGKIANLSYMCTKYISAVFKKHPWYIIYPSSIVGFKFF